MSWQMVESCSFLYKKYATSQHLRACRVSTKNSVSCLVILCPGILALALCAGTHYLLPMCCTITSRKQCLAPKNSYTQAMFCILRVTCLKWSQRELVWVCI